MIKILRVKEVAELTGLSIPSIYRLIQLGEFPQSIKIGLKAVGWRESDLQQWIIKNNPHLGKESDDETASE